ncbi:MAG: hypothetical protein D8M59_00115 [Planctomycetes bacterium]|nr:hypothetical protein [Planctomycetota bacterium]
MTTGPAHSDWSHRHAVSPRELGHAAPASVIPRIMWWNAGWVCVAASLALSLVGLAAIGITENPDRLLYVPRQSVFLIIGLVACAVSAAIHPRWWRESSYVLAVVMILLLVFVLLEFVPHAIVRPRNGARRWINLYFLDVQPSEVAKIVLVLALASYLRRRKNYRTLQGLLVPFVIMLVPMGLVLIEPDLGTAMLFPVVLVAMLIGAGSRLWHIFTIGGLGVSAVAAIALISLWAASADPPRYPLLQPHQVERIQGLVNQVKGDDRFAKTINYQPMVAQTVTGSGGFMGLGSERGRIIVHYNRLPFDHNDMIFAVAVCRWGFVGGALMIGLYLVHVMGMVTVAALTTNAFGRLVCIGFCAVLVSQVIVNVGMTIGLLPITGMTLPYISYGGSSLVSNFIMTGIVLGIAMRPPGYFPRRSFEFDPKPDEPDPLHRVMSSRR